MQIGVESARAVDNRRIFVVEPDEIIRAALQFMLHDENETHEIPDLAAAFTKAAEWKPDLVLLGRGILESAGTAAVGVIAARIPDVRILIVADTTGDPLVQAALQAGAHGTVTRPYTVESVRERVDIALGRRQPVLIALQPLSPPRPATGGR